MIVCAYLNWSGLAAGHSVTNGIRPARLYGWTSRLHGTPDTNYIMTMYLLTALPSVISGNSSAPPSGNSFSRTVTTQHLSRNRSVHIRYAIRCAGTLSTALRGLQAHRRWTQSWIFRWWNHYLRSSCLPPVFRYTSTSGLRHASQVADPEQPFTELPPDRTVEDPHVHVLQSRGAVSSVSIASTDLLYYVEPLPLDQFIHHDTQTVNTWPDAARQKLFAVARRDIAVARRYLASMTRYVDMQDAHLAACSGALDNNIPLMTVETFPRMTGGIRLALDEADRTTSS